MKRWHEDFPRTYREWKKYRNSYISSIIEWGDNSKNLNKDPWAEDVFNHQKGRFRKRNSGDCGVVKCYICHGDKYPKREVTKQEIISDIKFKEGLEEIILLY